MSAPLELSPPPKRSPAKAKPAVKGHPVVKQRKVWSGASKKISVSPLQMTLPGIGSKAL
jgi:hypothetical protein